MRVVFACAAVAAVCVSTGLGDKASLQRAEDGTPISPARIGQLLPDGTVAEWLNYGLRGDCDWERAFDCAGEDCGRWFLGETYCNLYVTNDMQIQPWYGGLYAERITLGWFWSASGAGTAENCKIVVEFFDGFDDACTLGDDALGDFLGGVVLDYGLLDSSSDVGFYYSDIDLCGLDWLTLPPDGAGAYSLHFATYDDGDPDVLLPATCAQPMLLACEPPQSPIQWDDDSPADWVHQVPGECHDYSWSYDECPTKLLQAAFAAYIDTNEPCYCIDFDGDCDTDQADLGILMSDWGCVGDDCIADVDGNGVVGHSDLGIFLVSWGCGT